MKNEQCEQQSEERKQDGFEPGPVLCKRGREWFDGLSVQERRTLWDSLPRNDIDGLAGVILLYAREIEDALKGLDPELDPKLERTMTSNLHSLHAVPIEIASQLYGGGNLSIAVWYRAGRSGDQVIQEFKASQKKRACKMNPMLTLHLIWWFQKSCSEVLDWLRNNPLDSRADTIRKALCLVYEFSGYRQHAGEGKIGSDFACTALGVPCDGDASLGDIGNSFRLQCPVEAARFAACDALIRFSRSALHQEWQAASTAEEFADAVQRMRESFILEGCGLMCRFEYFMRDNRHLLHRKRVPTGKEIDLMVANKE